MMNILDMADDLADVEETSTTLNVSAPAFVPRAAGSQSGQSSIDTTEAVTSEDDASGFWEEEEQWQQHGANAQWYGMSGAPQYYHDPNAAYYYAQQPVYYQQPVDMGYWMDQQSLMEQNLYSPPQQPKGNTYGRARSQHARW